MIDPQRIAVAVAYIAAYLNPGPRNDNATIAGFHLGRATGKEQAAYQLCEQARRSNNPDEAKLLRHLARHLCEQSDDIATRYIPPGRAVPSEAERYADRGWLTP